MNSKKRQKLPFIIIGVVILFAAVIAGSYYFEVSKEQTKGEVQYRCGNPNCSCHAGGNPSYGDGRTCCSNCKKAIK